MKSGQWTSTSRGRTRSPLFRAIFGSTVILVVLHGIALLRWGPDHAIVVIPWLVPLVESSLTFAAACVAFLALGRYHVVRDSVSYWIGMGFATFSVANVFRILTWPGLMPGDRSIIGHLTSTTSLIALFAATLLGIALLVSASTRWPARDNVHTRHWLWPVAGWLAFVVLVCSVMVVFERSFPILVLEGGRFTPLALAWDYLNALIFACGLVLSARRYLLTGDVLPGYTAFALITLFFFSLTLGLGGQRYALLFFIDRFLRIGGFWVMTFIGVISSCPCGLTGRRPSPIVPVCGNLW